MIQFAIIFFGLLKLKVPRLDDLLEMGSKLLQSRRTMCTVILNAMDIFMGHPVIDALVDMIADIHGGRLQQRS
jgi:hypothetical protein